MNQRAKLSADYSPSLGVKSPETAPSEPIARPKVMRRPPQFSSPTSATRQPATILADQHLDAPALDAAMPTTPASSITRPWQDDGRFAVALLAIVITVNVMVGMWLVAITKPAADPNQAQAAKPVAGADAVSDRLIHELSAAGAAALAQ